MTVNNRGFIIHKLRYKKERIHRYDIYKNNHPVIPKKVVNVVDLGCKGTEAESQEQPSSLPFKRKRNQDLSPEEKDYNRIIIKRE